MTNRAPPRPGQLGQQAAEPTARQRRGADLSLPDGHVAGRPRPGERTGAELRGDCGVDEMW